MPTATPHVPTRAVLAALAAAALGIAAAGCDLVPSPEHQSAAARKAAEHHELRDAIEHKTEREKAEHAGDAALDADKAHDKALEDAGG
jgi:hypothetical protein